MADKAAGAADALINRYDKVKLSDGSVVTVERWAWVKKLELLRMVGKMEHLPDLAEGSLIPEDRPKLATMADEDVVAIANAAIKLNVTKGLVGNIKALDATMGQMVESSPSAAPSKQP